jgi:hypothetical protein
MRLRKCVFSDILKEKFLFIKEGSGSGDRSRVLCSVSCAALSINHAGMADAVHQVTINKRQNTEQLCMQ